MRPFDEPQCGLSQWRFSRVPVIEACRECKCTLESFDVDAAASSDGQNEARRAV
jgi:hypothetical protein